MARCHVRATIRDSQGRAIQSARVYCYLKNTTTPASDLYSAETGGSLLPYLTSNAQGEAEGWVAAPKELTLSITDGGAAYLANHPEIPMRWSTPVTERYSALPPADEIGTSTGTSFNPALDQTITGHWEFNFNPVVREGKINPKYSGFAGGGARCDNAADDSAAWADIQTYVGDTSQFRAFEVLLPGISCLSQTLLIERKAFVVYGRGQSGQRNSSPTSDGLPSGFRWIGTNNNPLIQGRQAYFWNLRNLALIGKSAAGSRPIALIRLYQDDPADEAQPNSRCTFEGIAWGKVLGYDEDTAAGGAGVGDPATYGLLVDGPNNINGDQMRVVDSGFYQLTTGIKLANSQNGVFNGEDLRFDFCGTGFDTIAQSMLKSVLFSGSKVRDLRVDDTQLEIDGFTSEGGAQMALLLSSAKLICCGESFQITNALTGSGSAGTIPVIDATTVLGHPIIDLSDFSFPDGGYTNPGTPKLAMFGGSAGGTKKHLGLNIVNWMAGQGIRAQDIVTPPAGGSDELVITGKVKGAATNTPVRPIYNHLFAGDTANFARNDLLRSGLTPIRVKSGTPTDADFPFGANDGNQEINSADNTLWTRVGGIWRYNSLTTPIPPFNNTTVPNIVFWAEADLDGLANDAAVSSVVDRAATPHNATQATGANQPVNKTNIINARAAFLFDGTNDFLATAAFTLNSPKTVFVLAKAVGGANQVLIDGLTGLTGRIIKAGGIYEAYAGNNLLGPAADDNFHIISVEFNGASSKIRKDGGAGTAGNAGSAAMGGVTLGAQGGGAVFLSGYWAASLICSSILSLSDHNLVLNYLSAKYAISTTPAT